VVGDTLAAAVVGDTPLAARDDADDLRVVSFTALGEEEPLLEVAAAAATAARADFGSGGGVTVGAGGKSNAMLFFFFSFLTWKPSQTRRRSA